MSVKTFAAIDVGSVDLPHGIFPGEIKYFHGEFKAAHINGCEGFYTHKVPHFPNR